MKSLRGIPTHSPLTGVLCVVCLAVLGVSGARPTFAQASDPPVRIFAAASLVDLMHDLQPGLESATSRPVRISAASSATLARHIELGAEADLFISANPAWAERVQEAGLVQKGTSVMPWLSNVLVCVVPANSPLSLQSEADLTADMVETLALAAATVPLGIYSREAIEATGVPGGRRIVEGTDARDTLRKVVLGAADAGIVYATDAQAEPRVRVVFEMCPDSYTSVLYPLVCLGEDTTLCSALRDYLFGAAARSLLEAHGFILLDGLDG